MKKKIITLASMILFAGITLKVNATQTIDITIKDDMIIEENSINYEEEYAYEGEDYIYALVSFRGKDYSVPRSEYWKIIKMIDKYCLDEQNFLLLQETGVSDSYENEKENANVVEPPKKDDRMPWEKWTDEQWAEYSKFAASFTPDEWQKKLLEYYSLTEIYAYYMGGYTIDEAAYKAYVENEPMESSKVTESEQNTSDDEVYFYELYLKNNLFSMYDNEAYYYAEETDSNEIQNVLSGFSFYSEDDSITNPNAFVKGQFYFEIGTVDRKVTEYSNVNESKAMSAVRFINKNKVKKDDKLSKQEQESLYKVRICTQQSNGTYFDNVAELRYKDAMTLISTYLKGNSKTKSGLSIDADEPIYNG